MVLDDFEPSPGEHYMVKCTIKTLGDDVRFLIGLCDESGNMTWGIDPITGLMFHSVKSHASTEITAIIGLPELLSHSYTLWIVQWNELRHFWNLEDISFQEILDAIQNLA